MTVILHRNIGMSSLDIRYNFTQRNRASNTCHIFDADFIGSQFDKLQRHIGVVFHSMNRRMSDTKRTLRNHPSFLCIRNGRGNIADIIQSAECTGNICALCFLYFIEQFADICRNRTHTESVQRTVEHMSLNTGFVERLSPFTYSLIRILTKQ